MMIIKDHQSKVCHIDASQISVIRESTCIYIEGDEDKPMTELIVCGCFVYIEAPMGDVVKQLGI